MNNPFRNVNVAVLGLGSSGEAAARLLCSLGAIVTVLDTGESPALAAKAARLEQEGIRCTFGSAALQAALHSPASLAVTSPGIDPATPLVKTLADRGIDVIGELELAFSRCPWPVAAITGTNGKTTTTELVAAIFSGCGARTVACGNIGRPFSDVVLDNPGLDLVTLEASSFQLETIRSFHPRISAWLNFTPDHLDRYASMGDYYRAKLRIFENQTLDDSAVINAASELPGIAPRRVTFSAGEAGADYTLDSSGNIRHAGVPVFPMREAQFCGRHNAENFMAALAIGHEWGLGFDAMAAPLLACRPSAHRCERVREFDGVAYVNDSKSTNVDSLEKALLAMSGPVVLIAGGKEKGFAFASLRALVRERVRCAVLIGETRGRLERDWAGATRLLGAPTLEAAVELARAEARPGDTVLLSPGTSSFDMFKDYADRGERFRALINQMKAP